MGWNYLSSPKLQRLHRWSLGIDKLFQPPILWACDYLSMLGLKLNRVCKMGYWGPLLGDKKYLVQFTAWCFRANQAISWINVDKIISPIGVTGANGITLMKKWPIVIIVSILRFQLFIKAVTLRSQWYIKSNYLFNFIVLQKQLPFYFNGSIGAVM